MISSKQSPKTFKTGPHLWGMAFVISASLHMLATNLADAKVMVWSEEGCEISCPLGDSFSGHVPKRQTLYIDMHVISDKKGATPQPITTRVAYLARPSETDMTEALNGLTISKPTTIDLICTAQSNGRLRDCVALTSAANPLTAPTVALYERHVRLAPLPAGSSTLPKVKLHYNWPANI